MNTLQRLTSRIALIKASKVIGVCYTDEEGRLIQLLDDDPAFRLAILEYYRQQIQPLEEQQQTQLKSQRIQKTLKRQRFVAPE